MAVSPVLTEGWYTGGFLVTQAPSALSYATTVIANAGTVDIELNAGLVLSQNPGTVAVAAAGTNGANGTVGTISLGAAYMPGAYVLKATSATVFSVEDPGGKVLPSATVTAAYSDPEIKFTIGAGTGTYVAGDTFTLTAPGPSGTMVATGTATLPSVAVLYNRAVIPASGSKKVTIVSRLAEVNLSELQWDATILNAGTLLAGLQATAIAQLGSLGIIAR